MTCFGHLTCWETDGDYVHLSLGSADDSFSENICYHHPSPPTPSKLLPHSHSHFRLVVFKLCLIFQPYLGRRSNLTTAHIFQFGWLNYQPSTLLEHPLTSTTNDPSDRFLLSRLIPRAPLLMPLALLLLLWKTWLQSSSAAVQLGGSVLCMLLGFGLLFFEVALEESTIHHTYLILVHGRNRWREIFMFGG